MPKLMNKKFKRKADDTLETLYDLDKMADREVVWSSPKTPEVSSVVQFIIDNSAAVVNGQFTNTSHPNVLMPSGYVKDEEVISRDSNSEGDFTVLGVSPSITPSLACEVLITENNVKKESASIDAAANNTQQNCLREIDLTVNTNSNHNSHHQARTSKPESEHECEEYEDELTEQELNIDETEAMKELGYCIHRITYFKLYNAKEDCVRCSACDDIVGRIVREPNSTLKLEFTCCYCLMTFSLIGDLNIHLISHYHEQENEDLQGSEVIYHDAS